MNHPSHMQNHEEHMSRSARMGHSTTSGDEAIDRLNAQSLQAAQQGRVFTPGSGSSMNGGTGSSGGKM